MAKRRLQIALSVGVTLFGILAGSSAHLRAQATVNPAEVSAPLEPMPPEATENQIVSEMVARNVSRSAKLFNYSDLRIYQIADLKGKVNAQEVGRMEYHAPDKKSFTVTLESGSTVIRHLALKPLITSEIEAAAGTQHRDSSIDPGNYSLQLLGEQEMAGHRCFVAQAIPKRTDKYLFEGKIWVDVEDYAIVRIEGHPAKKLSFWIEQADFVRQYEKVGDFWLPQKDETFVQVRFYGRHLLTIDHRGYVVNAPLENHQTAEANQAANAPTQTSKERKAANVMATIPIADVDVPRPSASVVDSRRERKSGLSIARNQHGGGG